MIKLYNSVAIIWDISMSLSGLKRGLRKFISRTSLPTANPPATILELGCGSGIVSFALAEIYPQAIIVATDANQKMLLQTKKRRSKLESSVKNRILTAHADINDLLSISPITQENQTTPKQFDLIVVSAVLEHSDDLIKTLTDIHQLLSPQGVLLAINMANNPIVNIYAKLYKFTPITYATFKTTGLNAGFKSVEQRKISFQEFPTNINRAGFILTKQL